MIDLDALEKQAKNGKRPFIWPTQPVLCCVDPTTLLAIVAELRAAREVLCMLSGFYIAENVIRAIKDYHAAIGDEIKERDIIDGLRAICRDAAIGGEWAT